MSIRNRSKEYREALQKTFQDLMNMDEATLHRELEISKTSEWTHLLEYSGMFDIDSERLEDATTSATVVSYTSSEPRGGAPISETDWKSVLEDLPKCAAHNYHYCMAA